MGSYLSEPIKEKVSSDECNDKLLCGASSMQGWRITQEDAHNLILAFDENTSFFAVYDGHGGHEVAQYCSQKLPDFIKNTEAYKNGDIKQALIDGFLGFDKTITTEEVISVLKEIAGDKEEAEESSDEENVENLFEEASMPIEKVIEKYTSAVGLNPAIKNLKKGEKVPKSPMIIAKRDSAGGSAASSSNSTEAAGSASASSADSSEAATASSSEAAADSGETTSKNASTEAVSSSVNEAVKPEEKVVEKPKEDSLSTPVTSNGNGAIPEIKVTSPDSSAKKETAPANAEKPNVNGDISEEEKNHVSSTNSTKGKSPIKRKEKTPINRPKRNEDKSGDLYKKLLDFSSEDESEDDEDKTFQGPDEVSSDDDDEGINASIEAENSEEDSSENEDGEEEDIEEEEDEEMEDEDELEFARNMKEEPGSDSGCTAVVALLNGKELYVANAGDSRCIVCRNGKAIEMSFDHKPEDEPEKNRIVKAGGKVTADGRVNGGLNLSRAIGDHAYKQNKELSDKEQMITALPDIKTLTIEPTEDEFIVLACDGIWNFMSSQEVVDFVKESLKKNHDNVSKVCEELFDHCLAPNTMGDGTGCDNMTAIIVKLKSSIRKRSASPEPSESTDSKRTKTDVTQTSNVSEGGSVQNRAVASTSALQDSFFSTGLQGKYAVPVFKKKKDRLKNTLLPLPAHIGGGERTSGNQRSQNSNTSILNSFKH